MDDLSKKSQTVAPLSKFLPGIVRLMVLTTTWVILMQAVAIGKERTSMMSESSEKKQDNGTVIQVPAWHYQTYDVDPSLPYPRASCGGWKKDLIPIAPAHTAVVVMHAWDCGDKEGDGAVYYKLVDYVPRSDVIIRDKYPGFMKKLRASGFNVIHVGAGYERSIDKLPGYARVQALCPEKPVLEAIQPDPVLLQLRQLHYDRVLYGKHLDELRRTQEIRVRDFGVMPEPDEDVACTTEQLFAWCRKHEINHLIYTGFAVNACLVSSPCGRIDMTRRGIMCSLIRDLTSALESKESCTTEAFKEQGVWAFSIWGGFVFEQADIEKYLFGQN